MIRPSYEELESAWKTLAPSPTESGEVMLIVTRGSTSQMAKRDRPVGYDTLRSPLHEQPSSVTLCPDRGVVGDRWHAKQNPGDQVSLTSLAVSRLVAAGDAERYHLFGNNFIVDFDLSRGALPVGTQLRIGNAIIEISGRPHQPCNRYQARFGKAARRWANDEVHAERHLRGRYAQVIESGEVCLGDHISGLQ